MMETIVNYWAVWACGLIAAFFTWLIRYIIKNENKKFIDLLNKRETEVKKDVINKLEDEIQIEVSRSDATDKQINADIEILQNSVENLTRGLLAVQGKDFRNECRRLLELGHVITLDEYEECVEDHDAYNGLGGNHKGDSLFTSVMKKWNTQIQGE